jgi:hypothetical protein
VDRPAVIACIYDPDHGDEKLSEIGGATDFIQHGGMPHVYDDVQNDPDDQKNPLDDNEDP